MGKGGHGGGFAGGGHSHDPQHPDDGWNLYQHIDVDGSAVLNGNIENSDAGGAQSSSSSTSKYWAVMKPFVRKFEQYPCIRSDADEQVIVNITFASPVHVRRIMVIGGGPDDKKHPAYMKCFPNMDGVNFDNVEDLVAGHESALPINRDGEVSTAVPAAPFSNVTRLSIFFAANHSLGEDDETIVQYIGLQGDHTHGQRKAVHAVYEVIGSADDVQIPGSLQGGKTGF